MWWRVVTINTWRNTIEQSAQAGNFIKTAPSACDVASVNVFRDPSATVDQPPLLIMFTSTYIVNR